MAALAIALAGVEAVTPPDAPAEDGAVAGADPVAPPRPVDADAGATTALLGVTVLGDDEPDEQAVVTDARATREAQAAAVRNDGTCMR